MAELDMKDLKRRMKGAIDALHHEFTGIRSGRASASMLDSVKVNAYGSDMPLNQVGTVNAPEPRMLSVQVWDKGLIASVEKAIRDAGLGLNPVSDGDTVRVPIPDMTEERRAEMAKIAGKAAEQARIAARHVRKDGMDTAKKMEKDGDISEDEHRSMSDDIQKLTDSTIKEIDDLLAAKEKDIMHV